MQTTRNIKRAVFGGLDGEIIEAMNFFWQRTKQLGEILVVQAFISLAIHSGVQSLSLLFGELLLSEKTVNYRFAAPEPRFL